MRTEQCFIGSYYRKKAADRIEMLFENYGQFPAYMNGYKSGLKTFISSILASDRREEIGDPGVRVSSGSMSDITAQIAIENITIAEAIDKVDAGAFTFRDKQDEEDVFIAIHELELMKNEYSTLVCQLKSLPESDRKIFLPYLVGERTPEEIAEENCIGLESVYKRIYRVKKQMKSRMKMFMLDYSEGMKRVGRCS